MKEIRKQQKHEKKMVPAMVLAMVFILIMPAVSVYAVSSNVPGIDISSYNGTVDWEKAAEANQKFIMIRSGLGQNIVQKDENGNILTDVPDEDKQFEANYQGAKSIGLKVGVYHVCCTKTVQGAIAEAQSCLDILEGRPLEYPVAYDMEQAGTFMTGKTNVTAMAKAFCETIKEAGYTPMIYSTAGYLNEYYNWNNLGGIKIWVAHYNVTAPKISHAYDIWQYSSTGSIPGANTDLGVCDLNYSFMEAETVKFTENNISLGVKESYSPEVALVPKNCTDKVSFQSSNPSIASVGKNNGRITAVSRGTATITATTGSGQTATLRLTVKKAPGSVKLNAASKTMKKGTVFQLKHTLSINSASKKMTYTSNRASVATVNATGLIKGKKAGTAIITVTTYNEKKAAVKVIIK